MACLTLQARVKTTRSGVHSTKSGIEMAKGFNSSIDTAVIAYADSVKFNPVALTIKGYSKRAYDKMETFYVTNNTSQSITQVKILVRYSDMKGNMIHERTVTVNCNLTPYGTHQAMVRSFDTSNGFYYYLSSKPRNSAIPYQVAMRIVGYSLSIEP